MPLTLNNMTTPSSTPCPLKTNNEPRHQTLAELQQAFAELQSEINSNLLARLLGQYNSRLTHAQNQIQNQMQNLNLMILNPSLLQKLVQRFYLPNDLDQAIHSPSADVMLPAKKRLKTKESQTERYLSNQPIQNYLEPALCPRKKTPYKNQDTLAPIPVNLLSTMPTHTTAFSLMKNNNNQTLNNLAITPQQDLRNNSTTLSNYVDSVKKNNLPINIVFQVPEESLAKPKAIRTKEPIILKF